MTKHYATRAHECLDKAGNYYCRHVSAMTSEGLHEKSAIAGELAWRDYQIDQLKKKVAEVEASKEQLLANVRLLESERHDVFEALQRANAPSEKNGHPWCLTHAERIDALAAKSETEANQLKKQLEEAKDQLGQIAAELTIGPGDLDDGTYDETDLSQAQAGFALSCLSPIGVEEVALMMAAARIRERKAQRKIAAAQREQAQGEGRETERAAILARILRFEQAYADEPGIASALHAVYDAIEGGDV